MIYHFHADIQTRGIMIEWSLEIQENYLKGNVINAESEWKPHMPQKDQKSCIVNSATTKKFTVSYSLNPSPALNAGPCAIEGIQFFIQHLPRSIVGF